MGIALLKVSAGITLASAALLIHSNAPATLQASAWQGASSAASAGVPLR